jgi:hypothetical protein
MGTGARMEATAVSSDTAPGGHEDYIDDNRNQSSTVSVRFEAVVLTA